jgi:hypothetical protein
MNETLAAESLTPGTDLRRPPRPPELDGLDLMVRDGQGTREGLKSERVEEMLRAMPQWQLTLKGRGITQVKELPSPMVATLYSSFVMGLAAAVQLPVFVSVLGGRVLVTLHAPRCQGRIPNLTEEVFAFARMAG